MKFTKWMNKATKFTWSDVGLVKLSTAFIVLMLAKLWQPLLGLDWYGLLFLLSAIKPIKTYFGK